MDGCRKCNGKMQVLELVGGDTVVAPDVICQRTRDEPHLTPPRTIYQLAVEKPQLQRDGRGVLSHHVYM